MVQQRKSWLIKPHDAFNAKSFGCIA